jgi:hypothetical protein
MTKTRRRIEGLESAGRFSKRFHSNFKVNLISGDGRYCGSYLMIREGTTLIGPDGEIIKR